MNGAQTGRLKRRSTPAVLPSINHSRMTTRSRLAAARNNKKAQSHKKLIRNSISSFSQASLNPYKFKAVRTDPQMDSDLCIRKVVIRVLSNWGSSTRVSTGDISLLADNYSQIAVRSVEALPAYIDHNCSEFLSGMSCRPNIWGAEAVPSKNTQIQLNMLVDGTENLRFIRFFNSSVSDDSTFKDIEVWIDGKLYFKGEVTKNFPSLFELSERKFAEMNRELDNPETVREKLQLHWTPKDAYGYFPVVHTGSITVELLANRGNPLFIGLNAIQIYTIKNKLLGPMKIRKIETKGCSNPSAYNLLCKENVLTTDPEKMWVANMDQSASTKIQFTFTKPQTIGFVRIWNYSGMETGDVGVSRARIAAAYGGIWAGRLEPAVSTTVPLTEAMALGHEGSLLVFG